jgi:hypothetical protein
METRVTGRGDRRSRAFAQRQDNPPLVMGFKLEKMIGT